MFGAVEVTPDQTHVAERGVHPRIVWIERQGLFSQTKRLCAVLVLFHRDAHRVERAGQVRKGKARIGTGEGGIDLECLFVQRLNAAPVLPA